MARNVNVLITGMGGPLAISIFKALKLSRIKTSVLGTDAYPLSIGLFRADKSYIVPKASDNEEKYLKRMEKICVQEGVDIVFLGSETEIELLSRYGCQFMNKTHSYVVVNEYDIIDITMDKWKLNETLRKYGIECPASILPSDNDALDDFVQRYGFPLILKPRHSSGSLGLFRISNKKELRFFKEYVKNPILQEYLHPDDQEFTAGVFMDEKGKYFGSLVMKRELGAGLTYKSEVVKDKQIESICKKVGEKLNLVGPVNIQLRKTPEGPKIFEINPRFSSTTVMRAYFGFNEPEMAIRKFVFGEELSVPRIEYGFCCRYWDEIYIEKEEFRTFRKHKYIESPKSTRLGNI